MDAITPRPFTYRSRDGLELYGQEWLPSGPAAGRPVVCLPGVTRNSRDFTDLAGFLAGRGRRVVAFDFRGRGRSAHAPVETYTPLMEADDVGLGLDHLGIPEAALIGTSRGGLVIMTLAMTRPALLGAVVLNDIGPVIDKAGLARIAGYIGKPLPRSWPAAIADLKAGQGALFPALDEAGWERYARQIYRDEGGVPVIDYDPALEEAFKAFDPNAPLPDLWPAFDAMAKREPVPVPMMVVHGALSDILAAATVAEMQARHPALVTCTVADEGHAPLLWDAATQERIAAFLDGAERA